MLAWVTLTFAAVVGYLVAAIVRAWRRGYRHLLPAVVSEFMYELSRNGIHDCLRGRFFLQWRHEGAWFATDKVLHFVGHILFVVAATKLRMPLFWGAVAGGMTMVHAVMWAEALGWFIEVYQRFFSRLVKNWGECSRGASIKDLIADNAGIIVGILMVWRSVI